MILERMTLQMHRILQMTLQMHNWSNTLVLFCFLFYFIFLNELSAILLTLFNPKINSSDYLSA